MANEKPRFSPYACGFYKIDIYTSRIGCIRASSFAFCWRELFELCLLLRFPFFTLLSTITVVKRGSANVERNVEIKKKKKKKQSKERKENEEKVKKARSIWKILVHVRSSARSRRRSSRANEQKARGTVLRALDSARWKDWPLEYRAARVRYNASRCTRPMHARRTCFSCPNCG